MIRLAYAEFIRFSPPDEVFADTEYMRSPLFACTLNTLTPAEHIVHWTVLGLIPLVRRRTSQVAPLNFAPHTRPA